MKLGSISLIRLVVLLSIPTVIVVACYRVFLQPALSTGGSWIPQVSLLSPCTNDQVSVSFTMPRGRHGCLVMAFPATGFTNVHSSPPHELRQPISGRIVVSDGRMKPRSFDFNYDKVELASIPGEAGRHWPYGIRPFPDSSNAPAGILKPGKDYKIDVYFSKKPPIEISLALFWYCTPGKVDTNLNIRFGK